MHINNVYTGIRPTPKQTSESYEPSVSEVPLPLEPCTGCPAHSQQKILMNIKNCNVLTKLVADISQNENSLQILNSEKPPAAYTGYAAHTSSGL